MGLLVVLAGCRPAGEATVELTAAPIALDGLRRSAQVSVVATNADGTIGRGPLTLRTSAGELDETNFELDAYGTARTTLTCPAGDPDCTPTVAIEVRATWTQPKGAAPVIGTRTLRIAAPPTVWTLAACPPEAKLVYLFSESAGLYSYHPPTKTLTLLGQLRCAAGSAQPNSMAVSQDGVAWLNYSDGSLFRVNVRSQNCTPTSFVPPAGWTSFGMGFSADSASSVAETLYISSAQGLAKVDLATMRATLIGPFNGLGARGAELTSTPDGQLFGFFVPTSGGMQLASVAKDTAATGAPKVFPTLTLGNGFAYAFSAWGPDFYLYTSSNGANTTVTKYSPATDFVGTWMMAPAGVRILGAGVSRCGGD